MTMLDLTAGREGWAAFVDVSNGTVTATCYPLPEVPEERLAAVAELLTLIGATGVPFVLGVIPGERLIRLRNSLSFRGFKGDKTPLLRGLIERVVGAPTMYDRALRQVAFGGVDPTDALEQFETFSEEVKVDMHAAFERYYGYDLSKGPPGSSAG